MKPITSLDGIVENLRSSGTKKRVVVVCAHHKSTLLAFKRAVFEGFVVPIFIGVKDVILQIASEIGFDISNMEIIDEGNEIISMEIAINIIRDDGADVIMKGLINSSNFLSPLIRDLNPEKELIHHIAIMQVPGRGRLVLMSDVAVIVLPILQQKIRMIENMISVAKSLGIEIPKIAIVCASEKVSTKQPATMDADNLVTLWQSGHFENCIIEGPIAMDCVDDGGCCKTKKYKTQIGGCVDGEIYPSLEAGNIRYKTLMKYARATAGSLIFGLSVPCVLTSRGDSDDVEYYSLVCACVVNA